MGREHGRLDNKPVAEPLETHFHSGDGHLDHAGQVDPHPVEAKAAGNGHLKEIIRKLEPFDNPFCKAGLVFLNEIIVNVDVPILTAIFKNNIIRNPK